MRQTSIDQLMRDDASMTHVLARADLMARRERIVSAVLVGLTLIATHVVAGIVGAYVWDLMQGGIWA